MQTHPKKAYEMLEEKFIRLKRGFSLFLLPQIVCNLMQIINKNQVYKMYFLHKLGLFCVAPKTAFVAEAF